MAAAVSSELKQRMLEARRVSDALFETLSPAALYERPIAERHRLVFYLGHLEAFDWNLLGLRAMGRRAFHPAFDKLFEFGIDPPEGSTPSDVPADWPRVGEIEAYREATRAKLDSGWDEIPEQMVHAAIEHRLMHAETLAYLLHGLDFASKLVQPSEPAAAGAAFAARMMEIPSGEALLGQRAGEFGWDNEFARHQVHVPAFRAGKYKVTNGEYLEFVRAGAAAPHFWEKRSDGYWLRCMFEAIPLPADWPVYVTQQQAREYAEWKGMQLMREEEFHRAAYGDPAEGREYPWGKEAPAKRHGNFDFSRWDPAPVTAHPDGDSAFGVSQLVGNGWEWTSTVFAPFAGFEPFSFYAGYSANFFDGEHYVLKGGSPRTAACFLRPSFRNWFRGKYPYVFATFRLVESAE